TDDANTRPVDRHENEIAVVPPDIARRVAVEQIVVDVERVDSHPTSTHEHVAKASVVRGPARGVQRAERCPRTGDAIAARPLYISGQENLVAAKPGGSDVEMRRGAGASSHARIDAPESRIQHILQF